jgi:hypothetical protein
MTLFWSRTQLLALSKTLPALVTVEAVPESILKLRVPPAAVVSEQVIVWTPEDIPATLTDFVMAKAGAIPINELA